jgi:hypothetical protein
MTDKCKEVMRVTNALVTPPSKDTWERYLKSVDEYSAAKKAGLDPALTAAGLTWTEGSELFEP